VVGGLRAFFAGVFEGGIGKTCVFWMVFCGGVVVFLWWGCGFWMALKRGLRKCHFLKIFLWKLGVRLTSNGNADFLLSAFAQGPSQKNEQP
jgi:hypothetical protein